jgi:hypothetical protein
MKEVHIEEDEQIIGFRAKLYQNFTCLYTDF